MVLENEYDDGNNDDTISATLQIKASDVDFGSPPSSGTEPWFEQTANGNHEHKPIVVSFPNENGFDTEQNKVSNDRLPKVEEGESDIRRTSPMFLDSVQNRNARRGIFSDNENSDNSLHSLIFSPFSSVRNSNTDDGKLNNDHNTMAEIIVVKKPVKEPVPQEPQRNKTVDTDDKHSIHGLEFIGKPEKSQRLEEQEQLTSEQGTVLLSSFRISGLHS